MLVLSLQKINKMPNLEITNKFSAEKLLQATATLSFAELEKFVDQAIILKAKRNAQNVTKNEAELLSEINKGLTPKQQKRFDELVEKLELETMTAEENREFLRLTDKVEKQDAKRIELLGELAEIRNQTFREVVKELGIFQH